LAPESGRGAGPDPLFDPRADTELLLQAAEAAGEIARRHFRTSIEVIDKPGDLGPVTAVDLEIDRMLRARLSRARPDYGWLSEESDDGTARLRAERVFVVDPIDGTRSYIAGEPGFAVALAVVERGRPVAGVVHLPARGQTYSAAAGQGAFRDGRPIAVSREHRIEKATVLTARKQMLPEHWPGGPPPMERHFRSSLAWRMCLVAEGRFDSMLTFRRAFEWDIAAGALIAAEAGGRVTDGLGGALFFNNPEAMVEGVIAAPDLLHRRIMAHRSPTLAPGPASETPGAA
jgi:myo-inositol-1(or 4)-monophosphatase